MLDKVVEFIAAQQLNYLNTSSIFIFIGPWYSILDILIKSRAIHSGKKQIHCGEFNESKLMPDLIIIISNTKQAEVTRWKQITGLN